MAEKEDINATNKEPVLGAAMEDKGGAFKSLILSTHLAHLSTCKVWKLIVLQLVNGKASLQAASYFEEYMYFCTQPSYGLMLFTLS